MYDCHDAFEWEGLVALEVQQRCQGACEFRRRMIVGEATRDRMRLQWDAALRRARAAEKSGAREVNKRCSPQASTPL